MYKPKSIEKLWRITDTHGTRMLNNAEVARKLLQGIDTATGAAQGPQDEELVRVATLTTLKWAAAGLAWAVKNPTSVDVLRECTVSADGGTRGVRIQGFVADFFAAGAPDTHFGRRACAPILAPTRSLGYPQLRLYYASTYGTTLLVGCRL